MAARGYEFYLRVLKVSLTRSLRLLVRDTFSTKRSEKKDARDLGKEGSGLTKTIFLFN